MIFYRLLRAASSRQKAIFGESLVWATVIGWPLTATTLARSEPQFVLGLSWVAILLTGIDILVNLDTHEQVGGDD